MGRGGELAYFQPDYAPLKLEEVSATDVALFRPPVGLWGYSMSATDEALSHIANAITERDIEIATLQRQVADLEASAPADKRPSAPAGRRPMPPEQDWGPPPVVRDDQPAGERDEIFLGPGGSRESADPQARSVWEPQRETRSSTDWAALPKRSPADEDEQ
jgi:hypothetical protein